jgi:type IV pilus assembly protein PilE
MIVVAVVAILAALALPSYFDSVRKGRRSEAVAALAQVQQAQERWRANRSAYAGSLTAAPSATPPGLGMSSATTTGGLYTLAVDAADATGYTLSATAVSGTSQANDTHCSTMRIRLADGNVQYGGCGGCAVPAGALTDPHRCWSR